MNLEKLDWEYAIKMIKKKQGQFFVFSMLFLLLLMAFIYSIETDNTYIKKSRISSLATNIIFEACEIGIKSNGTYLESRFNNFSSYVSDYCQSYNYNCSLNIIKKSTAPVNLSQLNYSHFNYSIIYVNNGYNYASNFTC